MVQIDTEEIVDIEIRSLNFFHEILNQFEEGIELGLIVEIPVTEPYSTNDWYQTNYYADRWFKVKGINKVWELDFPDFPAFGFIRNFDYGFYFQRRFIQPSQRKFN